MRALSRSMLIDREGHICTGGVNWQSENQLGLYRELPVETGSIETDIIREIP